MKDESGNGHPSSFLCFLPMKKGGMDLVSVPLFVGRVVSYVPSPDNLLNLERFGYRLRKKFDPTLLIATICCTK